VACSFSRFSAGVTVIGTRTAVAQSCSCCAVAGDSRSIDAPEPDGGEKIQRVLEGDEPKTASGVLGDVLEMIGARQRTRCVSVLG